ncbi:hypothetical protein CHLRE_17g745347v5 [Chlamydomonas reinhardtii]|uniref:PHD-type domain-containing protein n=1 Tax=Chlamydomonas reinhardtii TaxID=3055 RepID=A0A2K3CS12_CHLRE|nr:uncharacterized protein CHLRE_17g745347v5 [Chlamydomonas reinhardtii]PNW71070.1 hypothetical protein CHLRE_17g745347v5 [Chlamydomonas reinhardtii]
MLEGGEGAEAWRGATPGGGGGSLVRLGEGGGAEVMLPGPGEYEADCLAQRAHDEEAVCCVCGDGLSLEPNIIVFCERCDIAVHQACYGVRNIPAEEWLCWLCRMYEEQQRAAGVPQDDVRPKRWEIEARGITHAELPGGSHAVSCCLCPVRNGAFKRTTDGKNWCHVICGMWQEGTSGVQVDGPDAVEGMNNIKADRWRSPCGLCGRTSGAVVKCNYGHGQAYFHPLCGRRAGNYLVARAQPGSRVFKHRAYCHNHSEAQRNKDYCTGAAARASEVMTAPVLGLGHGRRWASSSGGSLPGALPGGGLEGLDGGYGGAGGLEGGGALMGYGGEAGDMSGFMPPQPVKRKSGRPPKLQKLLQLQQLGNIPGGMGMGMGLGGEAEPGLPSPTGAVPGVGMVSPTGGYDASGQLPDGYNPIMQAAGPGRPPLAGRLSMSAAAKRRAEAAEAAGGYGGGYGAVKSEDGAGGLYDEYGGGRGSARATTSKTSSGGFGGPGARAGSRAAAGGAKGRGASAAVTATATSGGGRGMRGAGGYRVKEESAMGAESAAQAFRARMGAPSGAAGGGGVALTGLARLADLEHQRALVDTVRRRERSKRQQYRLLGGEALALKDSDPAGVLAFLQEWEWQAEDAPGTGPFAPEDVAQAPPPGETLIGRMLAASGHATAVSTEAAAADAAAAAATNAGGGGAITGAATGARPSSATATQPLTTTTGPGAAPGTAGGTPAVSSAPGATGGAAGGSAAPAPSISTASGAAPAGLLPAGQKRQRIPSAIALEAAASAQYGAVAAASPPTKRIKLKAKVTTPGSAAAAFGYAGSAGGTGGTGGGSGAEPARTSSRSRGGATGPQGASGGGASMSSAPGGGMDSEVGSAEKADGIRAAGPGRDWRRRVVMGPDGVWVPRGTPTADKQPSGGQAGAGNTGGGAPGGGGGGAVPGPGMYGDSGLQANAGMAGAQAAAAAAATAAAAAAATGASPGLDGGNGNGGYGQLFGVPTAVASSFPSGDLGFGAGADADLLMGDAGSFFADLGGDMVGGGGGFDGGGGSGGLGGGGDAAAMRGRGEGRGAAEARPGGGDEEDGRGGSSDAEADCDSGVEPPPRRRRLARQASQGHYLLLRSAAKAARDGSGSAAPAAIGAAAADEAAAGGANRRRKAAGVQSPSSADVAAPRKHSERGTREPEAKAEAAAGVGEDLPRATRAVMSQRAAEELNKRLPRGYRFERRPPEGGDR